MNYCAIANSSSSILLSTSFASQRLYFAAREGIQDFVNYLKVNDITLTTAEYFRIASMEDPDEDHGIKPADFESILNRVKRSGARVIVLKCGAEQVTKVLEQAWKLGLTENHAWVLTDSAVSEVQRRVVKQKKIMIAFHSLPETIEKNSLYSSHHKKIWIFY